MADELAAFVDDFVAERIGRAWDTIVGAEIVGAVHGTNDEENRCGQLRTLAEWHGRRAMSEACRTLRPELFELAREWFEFERSI